MEYRKDIQGLRAIAVLFVFIFHLKSSWLPGGFIGVDIFFVISGFLISSIILSKKEKGNFSFIEFYQSRIKRIVPAYYFLLLVVAIAAIFVFIGVDMRLLRKSFFWSALLNTNNYFSGLDTYFGVASGENPLLHTWTLAIEMQFYLFLPFLLVFINRKYLIPIFSVLTLGLFAYATAQVMDNQKNEMYFSLLARTPEFFMGVLMSLITRKYNTIFSKYSFILSLIGLAILVFSAFFITKDSLFPGALAILPCLGAVLIILFPSKLSNTILSNKPMVFIGEISYSLYLWHWAVMAFFRYYYNIIDFSTLQIIIIVPLVGLLSLFSYYYIEQSLRKVGTSFFIKCIIALATLNILSAMLMLPLSLKVSPIPTMYIMPTFGLSSHGKSFSRVEIFGDILSKNNKNILLGDSHALSMKSFFDYLGRKNSFAFKTITNDVYPPISEITQQYFTEDRLYRRAKSIVEYSVKEIKESTVIILVIAGTGDKFKVPIMEFINNLRDDQFFILISDFPTLNNNPVRSNRNYLKNNFRSNIYTKKSILTSPDILKYIAKKDKY